MLPRNWSRFNESITDRFGILFGSLKGGFLMVFLRVIQLVLGIVILILSLTFPGFVSASASMAGIFIIAWAAKDIYDEVKDSEKTGAVQKMEEKRNEIRQRLEEESKQE